MTTLIFTKQNGSVVMQPAEERYGEQIARLRALGGTAGQIAKIIPLSRKDIAAIMGKQKPPVKVVQMFLEPVGRSLTPVRMSRRRKVTPTPAVRATECTYCNRDLEPKGTCGPLAATRDHYMPRSRGGRQTVWACYQCNQIKGDMLPDDWEDFMDANPKWWTITPVPVRRAPRPRFIPYSGFPSATPAKEPLLPPQAVPVEYDDPEKQAGFSAAYAGRLHMLRIAPPRSLSGGRGERAREDVHDVRRHGLAMAGPIMVSG